MELKNYIPQSEVTKRFGPSRTSIFRMRRGGKVKARKLGSRVFIDVSSLFSDDPVARKNQVEQPG
jgi:hypothetical protein